MLQIIKRLTWLTASAVLLLTANAYGSNADFIRFQGHQTHLVESGTTGSAIVLIHGLGADLSRFERNIAALAKTHRIFAVDLIGFGRSDKPDIPYRIQLFVDQIKAMLDDRNITKATLVGNSMGGLVALQFAKQYPERVDKLVLVAPAFVFGLPDTVSAEKLAQAAAPSSKAEMKQYLSRILHNPVSDEMVQEELRYKQSIGDTQTIQKVAESLKAKQDVFTPESIATLTTPTLLIHGVSDGVVPVSLSRKLTELMPNTRLVEFSQSGHWPQFEQAEMFNEQVLDFVSP